MGKTGYRWKYDWTEPDKRYLCTLAMSNTIDYQSANVQRDIPSQREELRGKMQKMTMIWKLQRDKRHEKTPQKKQH